jgi:hypothetical protein
LRAATREHMVLRDLNTHEEQVFTTLLRERPDEAWACIADIFREANETRRFELSGWLSEGGHRLIGNDGPGPIQYVPAAILFGWVDEDKEEHAWWLARILPKTLNASAGGRLTRGFLASYGDDERVAGSLFAHFYSRSWCGNASDHFRRLREEAHEWLAGERTATVKRWIENYIDALSADIDRAEIDEERRP